MCEHCVFSSLLFLIYAVYFFLANLCGWMIWNTTAMMRMISSCSRTFEVLFDRRFSLPTNQRRSWLTERRGRFRFSSTKIYIFCVCKNSERIFYFRRNFVVSSDFLLFFMFNFLFIYLVYFIFPIQFIFCVFLLDNIFWPSSLLFSFWEQMMSKKKKHPKSAEWKPSTHFRSSKSPEVTSSIWQLKEYRYRWSTFSNNNKKPWMSHSVKINFFKMSRDRWFKTQLRQPF